MIGNRKKKSEKKKEGKSGCSAKNRAQPLFHVYLSVKNM